MWDFVKKEKAFLLLLFLFSLFLRGLFFKNYLEENHFLCDSRFYNDVAVQISNGNGIVDSNLKPNIIRVPGYLIFLSAVYKIFGLNSTYAMWIQIFIACLIPILIFVLSLILFPNNILLAKITSFISSMHLGFILFSGLLMTETLFCIFFLLFLIFFLPKINLFFCKNKDLDLKFQGNIFYSGIFLGIASLIRPVGQFLIVLSIVLLFISGLCFYEKIKQSLVLFFSWFLVVFWWLLRNWLLTGYVFFHAWTGIHFLHYFATPIYMKINSGNFYTSSKKLCNVELPYEIDKEEKVLNRSLNEFERSNVAQKIAIRYILKEPFVAIKVALYNIFKTCVALYSSDLLMIRKGYPPSCYDKGRSFLDLIYRFIRPSIKNRFLRFCIFFEIFFHLFIILGFVGILIYSCFNVSLLCDLFRFLPFVGLLIFLTLATGFARLRLPVEPFFIILASYFWILVFKKLNKKRVEWKT